MAYGNAAGAMAHEATAQLMHAHRTAPPTSLLQPLVAFGPPAVQPVAAPPVAVQPVAVQPVAVQPVVPMGVAVAATLNARAACVAVSVTGFWDSPGCTLYQIVAEADVNGRRLQFTSAQRFSAFVDLHEKLRHRQPAMRTHLPATFPLPKTVFNGSTQLKEERRRGLEQYLRVAVAVAPGGVMPPILERFLGM